jgi:hypothetical protein
MDVGSVTDLGIHYRSIYATTECPNRTAETKTARSVRRVSDFVLVGYTDIENEKTALRPIETRSGFGNGRVLNVMEPHKWDCSSFYQRVDVGGAVLPMT